MIIDDSDSKESVVEKALNSLTSLAEIGLLQNVKLKELVKMVAPLLIHPNKWIRFAAIGYLCAAAKKLPKIDSLCIVTPAVRPYLTTEIGLLDTHVLIDNLRPHMPRKVYNAALKFAQGKMPDHDSKLDLASYLRNLGITDEEAAGLPSMRYHISKTAKSLSRDGQAVSSDALGRVPPRDISIHTVFITPPAHEVS